MKYISLILMAGLLLTPGCARRISQNYYAASSVGEAAHTYRGVVISVRKVAVGEAEKLQDNTLGLGAGAVAGGVAASQIGKGTSAQLLGGVGGAVLGGLIGSYLQDELSSQTGMEYSVQLDNGQIMNIVQGDEEVYGVGQRVLVIVSKKGRSRVVPDQSYTPPAPTAAPVHAAYGTAPAAPQQAAVATAPAQQQYAATPVQPQRPQQFYVPQEGVSYVNVQKSTKY